MDQVKEFFDTSTIHGLSWISKTKRYTRFFWALVVIGGFLGATLLIFESFDNWRQSPISTIIETLPISRITFPNITVCPPRNLYLNLNYDLMQADRIQLTDDHRRKLFDYALEVIQDEFFNEIMNNLTKINDPDRYYNWYHGYTALQYPRYEPVNMFAEIMVDEPSDQDTHRILTSATSGNISTQYFGEKYDAEKVDGKIWIKILLHIHPSLYADANTTLMIKIERNMMKDVSGPDEISFEWETIDPDLTEWEKNITAPAPASGDNEDFYYYTFLLTRRVSDEDIKNVDLDMMPGFRLTWNLTSQRDNSHKFRDKHENKNFVR